MCRILGWVLAGEGLRVDGGKWEEVERLDGEIERVYQGKGREGKGKEKEFNQIASTYPNQYPNHPRHGVPPAPSGTPRR